MLDVFRENLSRELDARHVDYKRASLEAGLGDSYVSDILKRREPKLAGIAQLVRTHRLSLDELLGLAPSERAAPRPAIEIIGEVTAGRWREAQADDFHRENSPFPPDPNYPAEAQFDLIVRGNSLNKFARDGDRLRCIDIRKAGLDVRDGDMVIFERAREGGQLIETTAKRVRRRGPMLELWPESDDPRWQDPLRIDIRHVQDGENGRVIARVLYAYKPASER